MSGRRRRRWRQRQPGGTSAASPATGVDLVGALARSHPDDDVQCPSCGEISRRRTIADDEPTLDGYACAACGRQWKVAPGAPRPDVVVDATVGRPAPTAAGPTPPTT